VVADGDRGHAGTDLHHHAAALVAEDAGEDAFGILARQGVGVGVADAGGDDADHHLARLGSGHLDLLDLQRTVGFPGDGGARQNHGVTLCKTVWRLLPPV